MSTICTRSHEEMIGCLTVLTRRGDEMFLWKIAFMVAESSGNFYFILQNVKKIYGAIGNRNFIHSTCITWLEGRPKKQTGAAARAKAPTRSLITLASVATCYKCCNLLQQFQFKLLIFRNDETMDGASRLMGTRMVWGKDAITLNRLNQIP